MEEKIRTFRDLRVWQHGIELVKTVYSVSKRFPKDEQFVLAQQIRRSAISIPSNIAEGFRRKYGKEHSQFLNIALGSCAELETQIVIAKELKYISAEEELEMEKVISHICGMIVNLNKKICS